MKNPDKWIRKYYFTTFSDTVVNDIHYMIVNGKKVRICDTMTPDNEDFLIILSTQSGSDRWTNKCAIDKMRDINIDVVTRYSGNVGSRAFLDDIIEEILQRTEVIEVDHFIVQNYNRSYPLDINESTTTQSIYRKIIKYSFKLTEDGR